VPSDLRFVSLAGGDVTVGLRDDDLATIDAIEPGWSSYFDDVPRAHRVMIAPFWVTRYPISNGDLRRLGFGDLVPARADSIVARVTYEDARAVAGALGGRLPTDNEWEYLCRAESRSLLPFEVDQSIDRSSVAPWMEWSVTTEQPENAFGLRVLYTGEWCDSPGVEPVQCGGGAYFWPWQDQEWVWCLPTARAFRHELPEPEASFRVVLTDPSKVQTPKEGSG
jgi:formylglycine-generating enzyme required for sulfatase activity